jgi:hypothetical protein
MTDMFLFSRLVLDNLIDQPDKASFSSEIRSDIFPKDLRTAYVYDPPTSSFASDTFRYERIVENIKSRANGVKWRKAVQLLGWMACARRPMRWHEIQAAASIDPGEESLQYDLRKFRDQAQELCGALILELPGQRLTLVHTTART